MLARGSRLFVALSLVSGLFAAGHSTVAAATTGSRYMFAGHGYGTFVRSAGVNSGKSANVVMWCRTKPGIHHTNSIASVSVDPVLSTGSIESAVDGTRLADKPGRKAQATTDVHNLSLLGGLISADELRAVSSTVHSAAGYELSDDGLVWLNLNVLGQPLGDMAPNTRVDIPLVGYAIFNEQVKQVGTSRAVFVVNMIHVHATLDNPLGIPKGTQVIVGHASSGLAEVAGPLAGSGYVTKVTGAGALTSGPTAIAYLPCAGTDGRVKSNRVGKLSLTGLLGLGSGTSTASGTVTPSTVKGDVQSVVEGLQLLGGELSADTVKAHVHAVKKNGKRTFTSAGSAFGNLVVQGQSYGDSVPANTKIDVPGLGTLWLYRVVQSKFAIEVRMIELKVGQNNPLGLPIGSDVRIGVARIAIF